MANIGATQNLFKLLDSDQSGGLTRDEFKPYCKGTVAPAVIRPDQFEGVLKAQSYSTETIASMDAYAKQLDDTVADEQQTIFTRTGRMFGMLYHGFLAGLAAVVGVLMCWNPIGLLGFYAMATQAGKTQRSYDGAFGDSWELKDAQNARRNYQDVFTKEPITCIEPTKTQPKA